MLGSRSVAPGDRKPACRSRRQAQGYFYSTSGGSEIDLLLALPVGSQWALEIKRSLSPRINAAFTPPAQTSPLRANSWRIQDGSVMRSRLISRRFRWRSWLKCCRESFVLTEGVLLEKVTSEDTDSICAVFLEVDFTDGH
jgi:hypothetical protein